jgi:HAD superfamily hydrolase (TIGR01458 family)
LLLVGAPLLAIASNRYFKDFDGLSLDAGPFIAALEYAAQVEANVFGKPAPAFFDAVLADLGAAPDETVMIGDDVEADVNGALAVGLQAILVRTGKYRAGDELRMNAGGKSAATVREAVTIVLAGS